MQHRHDVQHAWQSHMQDLALLIRYTCSAMRYASFDPHGLVVRA